MLRSDAITTTLRLNQLLHPQGIGKKEKALNGKAIVYSIIIQTFLFKVAILIRKLNSLFSVFSVKRAIETDHCVYRRFRLRPMESQDFLKESIFCKRNQLRKGLQIDEQMIPQ